MKNYDCINCQKSIDVENSDEMFCPECGERLEEKYQSRIGMSHEQEIQAALINCSSCDSSISSRAIECPKCGTKQSRTCNVCQQNIPLDRTSCPNCGDPEPFNYQNQNHTNINSHLNLKTIILLMIGGILTIIMAYNSPEMVLVLVIGICFIGYGLHIKNRGWARRWEMFPFLGMFGAFIIGSDKVYGGSAKFAALLHILVGFGIVMASFLN